jgi:lipoyl(octanoyl) transferase
MQAPLIVRPLGQTDFAASCLAMQRFTAQRTVDSADELWLTEHAPVYSLGLNRKQVRLPSSDAIPLVHTDRGGKITYHGPGQVVIYVLLDLKRRQLNIRSLVTLLEKTVVDLLASYGVPAFAKADAPGVYVNCADGQDAKVAALGLRIKNNYCYHGLSLNVDMDLSPFLGIDPCGYAGLKVTQTKDLGVTADSATIAQLLLSALATNLNNGYLPTEAA